MCGYEDIISMSVGIKVCYRLFLSLLGDTLVVLEDLMT
jgi:hypothetical protein